MSTVTANTLALDVSKITRTYRVGKGRQAHEVIALAGVDLQVPRGEVHGLLGPNGAGKTTLCKILSTILLPTTGTAAVMGHNVVEDTESVRRLIGLVLGGDRGLYGKLSAVKNLEFWAAMYGIPARETGARISIILERVGLEATKIPVDRFSRGMKQRLHLARGLMASPEVLILDEPTIGMDPVSATAFRDLVKEVQNDGATVLITTHDMAEAEAVCDRVSLIDNGVILATESPAALGKLISTFERIDVDDAGPAAAELAEAYARHPTVATAVVLPTGVLRIETKADGAVPALIRDLLDRGYSGIRVGAPSLNEVYVNLIGDRGMKV